MTKISINKKSGVTFKLTISDKEYFLSDSITSVDVKITPNAFICVEEINKKEKLTFKRVALFFLSQLIMIVARFISFAQPDWRDYIDPFILKSIIQISDDTSDISLRYSPGGYSKKTNSFFLPKMVCNSNNVSITTEVKPDYNGLRDTFLGFMINTSLFMVIGISVIFTLLCISYKNMNFGILILILTILIIIVITLISIILYNRYKYVEIKERLKEFVGYSHIDDSSENLM